MVAAVYVVGGETPDNRADLRYSLRSLVNAPVVDDVWVVGDVPAWFAGVKVPLEPLPDKFQNQRQSVERFVNLPGAPERFYLFNDDMFIVEPVHGPLPTVRNRAALSGWLKADGRRPNHWHRAVLSTAEWVSGRVEGDPPIYECHTPLLFDTRRLREAVNAYPAERPFAVGEMYPLAGCGGVGEAVGNAKCKGHDNLDHKLSLPMPYLSGNPDTWAGALGDLIRGMFPEPCKWEVVS